MLGCHKFQGSKTHTKNYQMVKLSWETGHEFSQSNLLYITFLITKISHQKVHCNHIFLRILNAKKWINKTHIKYTDTI